MAVAPWGGEGSRGHVCQHGAREVINEHPALLPAVPPSPQDHSAGSAGTACSCRRWGPGDLAARGLVNILGALLSAGDGEARSQSPFISVRPPRGSSLLSAASSLLHYSLLWGLGCCFFSLGRVGKKAWLLLAKGHPPAVLAAAAGASPHGSCLPAAVPLLRARGCSPCPG